MGSPYLKLWSTENSPMSAKEDISLAGKLVLSSGMKKKERKQVELVFLKKYIIINHQVNE